MLCLQQTRRQLNAQQDFGNSLGSLPGLRLPQGSASSYTFVVQARKCFSAICDKLSTLQKQTQPEASQGSVLTRMQKP